MTTDSAKLLLESLKENHPAIVANKKIKERETMMENRVLAGVIGVGAGGGNVAHLLTGPGYMTAALNTTQADMQDINVDVKIAIKDIDGSGKDRNFSAREFKRSYKHFFEDERIKKLIENDLIFVVGTGGGGTGTIISVMTAGFLKNEYPNKTIILVGLLGSIKEDLVSQQNMLEFMSDLENRAAGCPYMLFDNNRVKNKVGDEVYEVVNQEAARAIRLVSREYFIENARSNIDSRDYARLTSFGGLMSVVMIDRLNFSVADEQIDLVSRVKNAIDNSTAVVTTDPDAYGFFMNTNSEVYARIDTTFNDIQASIGIPTAGLVFRHLQNSTDRGPEMGIIMTGMASPVARFNMISTRIEEYKEAARQKAKIPTVERERGALNLAGDQRTSGNTGAGGSFMEDF